MQRDIYLKTAIIESHDAEEVTERLNALLKEYRNSNVKYERGFDASVGHFVTVEWTEETIIPETIRDEFYLRGELHHCGECPKFQVNSDKRCKYCYCDTGLKVWYEREACEELYKGLQEGTCRSEFRG